MDSRRCRFKVLESVNARIKPAVMLNIGVNPSESMEIRLRFHGPAWLCSPVKDWPSRQLAMKIHEEWIGN